MERFANSQTDNKLLTNKSDLSFKAFSLAYLFGAIFFAL